MITEDFSKFSSTAASDSDTGGNSGFNRFFDERIFNDERNYDRSAFFFFAISRGTVEFFASPMSVSYTRLWPLRADTIAKEFHNKRCGSKLFEKEGTFFNCKEKKKKKKEKRENKRVKGNGSG